MSKARQASLSFCFFSLIVHRSSLCAFLFALARPPAVWDVLEDPGEKGLTMESAEFVVVGAGLAGAGTAYGLTQAGASDVVVLEQEDAPGVHSSGRNAAMIRQVVSGEDVAALAREGAAFLQDPPAEWDQPPTVDPHGSLLLGGGDSSAALREDMAMARSAGVEVQWLDAEDCRRRVPALEGADFEGAVWCPSDGVVDVAALLSGFLREAEKAGARLATRRKVEGFEIDDGRIAAVLTNQGPIRARVAINAAGAWAEGIGRMAGAADCSLTPFRRHIYVTGPMPEIPRDWPFVWDVAHEIYFRPEPPGLLMSPCDEAPEEPGIPKEDLAAAELLGEKLERYLPYLADVTVSRVWAGLRTMAPDRRFVIGWDGRCRGFFWVAGLGGHGVTASAAVGSLAARLLSRDGPDPSSPFDPGRFS
jgi:D-arginine dehydrogenase